MACFNMPLVLNTQTLILLMLLILMTFILTTDIVILLLHYITNSGWNAKTTLSPRESLWTGSQNTVVECLTSYWLSRFWRNFQSQMHAIGYSCSAWVNCMFYSYYLSCYPRRCLICKCKQQVQVAEHSNTYSYIFTYLENYDTTWKGFK